MTNEEIKTECEAQYKAIRDAEQRLKELRAICPHEAVFQGNYSFRIGSITAAIICATCGEYIREAREYELSKSKKIMSNDIQKDDYFGNLYIHIPIDVARHPDGTSCSYIHWEDKQRFFKWAHSQQMNLTTLSGKEIEELLSRWKKECPDQYLDPHFVCTSKEGNKSVWELKNRNDE